MKTFAEIKEKLTGYGLKATQQRIVIYSALCNSSDHPNADDIYREVKHSNPSISLGTVYKALEQFISCGLIRQVKTARDNARYDANLNAHDHLYCTKTKKIMDFQDKELRNLIENYFKQKRIKNFKVKDIQLQISGELME